MNIPQHLRHLRIDHRGIPVPYINQWGPQDPNRIRIRFDANVNGPGLFVDETDQTVPDFKRQCMQRQRECMTRGLCQVCSVPVPWPDRRLILAKSTVQILHVEGLPFLTVTEPWLCPPCARFALTRCPALIRQASTSGLELIDVTDPSMCAQLLAKGWVEGPLEAESKRLEPAMWVKLILKPELYSTGSRISRALSGRRWHHRDEYGLQAAIAERLTQMGIPYERETRLTPSERIDFLCHRPDGLDKASIGIEVKVSGSTQALLRQLLRYARTDKLNGLVVLTSRPSHLELPPVVGGLPCTVILAQGAL